MITSKGEARIQLVAIFANLNLEDLKARSEFASAPASIATSPVAGKSRLAGFVVSGESHRAHECIRRPDVNKVPAGLIYYPVSQ